MRRRDLLISTALGGFLVPKQWESSLNPNIPNLHQASNPIISSTEKTQLRDDACFYCREQAGDNSTIHFKDEKDSEQLAFWLSGGAIVPQSSGSFTAVDSGSNSLSFQVDAVNHWSDGSVRWAEIR